MTNFEKARRFLKKMHLDVPNTPHLSDDTTMELRMDLICETVEKLMEDVEKKDLVGIASALTHILYVTYGFGLTLGIDLDVCFAELHKKFMSTTNSLGQSKRDLEL